MFNTNPVWRWQNLGEFRMLFNTLLNYRNLDTPPPVPRRKAPNTLGD
jgi:hypothetical protein